MEEKEKKINLQEPEITFSGTRETGMTVPSGFFEDFQAKMEQAIDREAAPNIGRISAEGQEPLHEVSRWNRWIGIAACAVIVAVAYPLWQVLQPVDGANTEEVLAQSAIELATEEEENDLVFASMSDYDLYDLYCEL